MATHKLLWPHNHISYRGPDILRNVIVSWYVAFYQINKFFEDVGLLLFHYWHNGFAGRMKWFRRPDLVRGP